MFLSISGRERFWLLWISASRSPSRSSGKTNKGYYVHLIEHIVSPSEKKLVNISFQTFTVEILDSWGLWLFCYSTICDSEKRPILFRTLLIFLPGLDPGSLRHQQFTLTTSLEAQRAQGLIPSKLAKNGLADDPSFAICRGIRLSCSSPYHDVR